MARKLRRAFFFCMMKCWLAEWLDFLFPVGDGEPCASISDSGGADPLKSASGKDASAPPDAHADSLPEIPPMFRAEPLVQEAERVVRGTPLTVKNIKDALRRSRR